VVATSWTGDTRVGHQLRYIYIVYIAYQLLSLLYGDYALIIQLAKVELNS